MQVGSNSSLEIQALTGLRGICALWVMLFHAFFCSPFLGTPLDWVLSAGHLGVDVFFVLSGFVLAYNYASTTWTAQSYLSFLRKRVARIYPVHAFMLLVFVVAVLLVALAGRRLLPPDSTRWIDLVRSLLLVHAWEPLSRFPWNGPSWTISAEWAAYMAFPLVAWAAIRIRNAAVAVVLVALLYAAYALWIRFPLFDPGALRRVPQLTASFCAGVLLWRITSLTSRTRRDNLLAVFALVLLIVGSSSSNMLAMADVADRRFPIIAAALVYFLARSDGWLARFLSTPAMLHLGRISYSLYLVHILFMHLSDLVIRNPHTAWLIRIVAVSAAILAAHLLYTWVEEPCRKAIVGARKPTPADVWNASVAG